MSDTRERTVLLLAPGRDGALTCELLQRGDIACHLCASLDELLREMEAGAGAVILAEEALTRESAPRLVAALRQQPQWSDLPVLVVARDQERPMELLRATRILGSVMILPRPIPIETLLSTVEAALGARHRQYQVRDLLRMRDEADRRKDEFLAMLGHELRNPLSPIMTAAHALRIGRSQDPFVERHAGVIERHARQLTGIVDDLLDVARITHGKVRLRRESVLLSSIIEQAVETCSAAIQDRNHHFTVTLPNTPVWLNADTIRLIQVFCNLLNNAAKYTEPGGEITLTGELEGEHVVVRVRDTGIGMPADLLPHVFDTFVQAPRALDRAQGGLGLGLAMVRRLTEIHGGAVEAHSEGVGRGSEFSVRLPTMPAPQEQPNEVETPQPPTLKVRPAKCPVLVVDDNYAAAESLAELLELWGYPVEIAHDGIAALESARRFRPRVVLLDLNLPGKDGYAVAQELRQETCRNGELIVAVTGQTQEEARRRALEAGFDCHLAKPIDPAVLQQLLSTMVASD